jgi:hypothetical protein
MQLDLPLMYRQAVFAGYKLGYRDFRCWHFSDMADLAGDVGYWGDSVAKVENRTASKISRKTISRPLYRCKAPRD